MFGDVHVTKRVLRWRTALIVRELEDEVRAIAAFRPTEAILALRMGQKEALQELTTAEYKAGFSTDIDMEFAPKGLSEDIVRFISKKRSNRARTFSWKSPWRPMRPACDASSPRLKQRRRRI